MFILAIASLLSTVLAAPPIWFTSGKCGVSKYPDAGKMPIPTSPGKIVGGIEARPYEFPWQASLRFKPKDFHMCGGSIINDRWIATASHCFTQLNKPEYISVVVGEHTQGEASAVRQTIEPEAIFTHEKYSGEPNYFNDIALVKTKTSISFNENVQPICAPDPANKYTHQKCQASGWGHTSDGQVPPTPTLRYVSLNVTTNVDCQSAWGRKSGKSISDDQICGIDHARGNVGSTCEGDSGGPLVVKDGGGIFTLIGATSFGATRCPGGLPSVYTRVGSQAAWITDKMAKNS